MSIFLCMNMVNCYEHNWHIGVYFIYMRHLSKKVHYLLYNEAKKELVECVLPKNQPLPLSFKKMIGKHVRFKLSQLDPFCHLLK
jgi:hypothetical protein